MANKTDWSEYYDFTRAQPPREQLVEAFAYVKNTGKALDIGGGALRDTRYLLGKGFDMTVIDKSPLLEQEVKRIHNERLHSWVTSVEDFKFPVDEYDLVSAMFSLPFCEPAHFTNVIANIKSSLKNGGIFCGQMFGDRDEWVSNPQMTYLTIDNAKEYLKDFELISFREEEIFDDTGKPGTKQHNHIFHFIARK